MTDVKKAQAKPSKKKMGTTEAFWSGLTYDLYRKAERVATAAYIAADNYPDVQASLRRPDGSYDWDAYDKAVDAAVRVEFDKRVKRLASKAGWRRRRGG